MTPLEELVADIDREHAGQDTTEWVQVAGTVGHLEFVRHTDLSELFGFVAPRRCWALAMTAPGWARSTHPPTDGSRVAEERVRITCVVARDGGTAGRLRWTDGTLVDEPPRSGRSLDILRRGLGLATDPPALPSGMLLAAQWLETIMTLARRHPRPLTWDQVVRLHPAMRLAEQAGLPLTADDMVTAARLAARVWSWSDLLRQTREDSPLALTLPPGAGQWMDEGMLSRWLLSVYPPLHEHLSEVTALVPPDTGRQIEGALGVLELWAAAGAGRGVPTSY
jgi:hypothetical protein